MNVIQTVFDEAFKLRLLATVAKVISESAASQGFPLSSDDAMTLAKHLDDPAQYPMPSLAATGDANEGTLDLSAINIDEPTRALFDRLPLLINSTAVEEAPVLLANLKARWPEQAESDAAARAAFTSNLRTRWSEPFALLGMISTIAREFGQSVMDEVRGKESSRQHLILVVTSLHARACQVMEEVRILLGAGYADGAMARCRTMHEIAVTGMFIQQHGEHVAERFVLHQYVESRDALKILEGREAALNEEPIDQAELSEGNDKVAELCRRFGDPFETPYGWAAEALSNRKPTFRDVERATNMGHWRPYYKLASHNVHSSSKGAFERLGLMKNDGTVLLAGASNFGLSLPAHSASISLVQMSAALNQLHPNLDGIVIMRVMQLLCDELGETFLRASNKLRTDEESFQSSRLPGPSP